MLLAVERARERVRQRAAGLPDCEQRAAVPATTKLNGKPQIFTYEIGRQR